MTSDMAWQTQPDIPLLVKNEDMAMNADRRITLVKTGWVAYFSGKAQEAEAFIKTILQDLNERDGRTQAKKGHMEFRKRK